MNEQRNQVSRTVYNSLTVIYTDMKIRTIIYRLSKNSFDKCRDKDNWGYIEIYLIDLHRVIQCGKMHSSGDIQVKYSSKISKFHLVILLVNRDESTLNYEKYENLKKLDPSNGGKYSYYRVNCRRSLPID